MAVFKTAQTLHQYMNDYSCEQIKRGDTDERIKGTLEGTDLC